MEIDFPYIIETISNLQKQKNLQFITTKRLRKILKIPGEELKLVRLIANTLTFLEKTKFLVVIKKYPKLYQICPNFSEKTRSIIEMYRPPQKVIRGVGSAHSPPPIV